MIWNWIEFQWHDVSVWWVYVSDGEWLESVYSKIVEYAVSLSAYLRAIYGKLYGSKRITISITFDKDISISLVTDTNLCNVFLEVLKNYKESNKDFLFSYKLYVPKKGKALVYNHDWNNFELMILYEGGRLYKDLNLIWRQLYDMVTIFESSREIARIVTDSDKENAIKFLSDARQIIGNVPFPVTESNGYDESDNEYPSYCKERSLSPKRPSILMSRYLTEVTKRENTWESDSNISDLNESNNILNKDKDDEDQGIMKSEYPDPMALRTLPLNNEESNGKSSNDINKWIGWGKNTPNSPIPLNKWQDQSNHSDFNLNQYDQDTDSL